MQRQFGERVAMNSPIQGSAADIMKIAMINVAKELKEKDLKSIIEKDDLILVKASRGMHFEDIVKEICSK